MRSRPLAEIRRSNGTKGPSRPQPLVPDAPPAVHRSDLWLALVLTTLALGLQVVRAFHAGGLWRDEAATAHLAHMFSFSYVIGNARYELFPALVPAALHVFSWVAGNSDLALRIFGMLVGFGIIGALWWNAWAVRQSVPMLSLALVGFNGVFLSWGAAVRGYGLGVFFLLMTIGLVWRTLEHPSPGRIGLAMLSGVASVQCLFNNAFLLLVICAAAAAVAWRREAMREAALSLTIGLPAALSLLPYLQPLQKVRDWDIVVRTRLGVDDLCVKLGGLLAGSGWWNALFWIVLFVAAAAVCVLGQSSRNKLHLRREHVDVLLFSGVGLLFGLVAYLSFLLIVSYPTRPCYYLALAALAALLMDVTFDTLQSQPWARKARLGAVLVIAIGSLLPTWQEARLRQTNVDLVAVKLNDTATKDDFILVTPWYDGITFDRYYHGPAAWMTVPPIEFHKFHRYDLVKAQMILRDQNEPVRPILDKISETLKGGHHVWLAGVYDLPKPGEAIPNISPAPDDNWGWQDEAFTAVWTLKALAYLQASAQRIEDVPLGFSGPVNPLENLSLKKCGRANP